MRLLLFTLVLLLVVSGATKITAQGPPGLEEALSLKEEGRCTEAIKLLESLRSSPDALFALGECLEEEARGQEALNVWQEFLNLYPQDPRASPLLLRLGHLYKESGNGQAALQTYLRYARSGGPLADVAWEEAGDIYLQMNYYQEAVKAYRQAYELNGSVFLRQKIIEALAKARDYDRALAECRSLEKVALLPSVRAGINYLCGKVYQEAGNARKAYSLFRQAIEFAPESPYSYSALIELVEANEPVDDYVRGLVDYYACSSYPQACGAALLAFGRYVAAHPSKHKAEAHYYAALIYRKLGDYQASLKEWDWLIYTHPESHLVPEGWWEKGRTLERAGREEEAISAYRKLSELYPDSPFATKALMRAARLLEDRGDFSQASSLYLKMAGKDKEEAFFRAGLALYRAGDLDSAVKLWKEAGSVRAYFWLGKALMRKGQWAEARSYWERAYSLSPESYYGLRALASLRKLDFASGSGFKKPEQELSLEDLREWLRSWASGQSSLNPENDSRLFRAESFLLAGYRDEALALYRRLLWEYFRDPQALAYFTFYFRQKKLYSLSIRSAMVLINRAQEAGVSVPLEVWRMAYPLFFPRLLEQEASSWGIDPLLLAAIIRQESLFDPWVSSPAGAIGLMQIMPSTGKAIASAMDWPEFLEKDLEKPWVSLKFGTWYLAKQKERFGHWFKALAAYNAGPVRVASWWEQAGGDPDLFLEIIPVEETARYIKAIYEQYAAYREAYRSSP